MIGTDAEHFDAQAIERWALSYLERLSNGGRRSVLLGGSIARGQQWAHSDLEAGLLIGADDLPIPYFNVDSGRGVEVIQLEENALLAQLDQVDAGQLAVVADWPIQLYQARVVSDPTGVFARFTAAFDAHLFSEEVVARKIEKHASEARRYLDAARLELAQARAAAALSELRHGMNESLLVQYWGLGELPRSQNRAESLLRDLTSRHAIPEFYQLYGDVFDLGSAAEAIANDWPQVKQRVLELAELWNAAEFFEKAVDSTFSWGEDAGIICVYRLYIPVLGKPDAGIFSSIDDSSWRADNAPLLRFLGLAHATPETVQELIDRVDHALDSAAEPSKRPSERTS